MIGSVVNHRVVSESQSHTKLGSQGFKELEVQIGVQGIGHVLF